MITRVLKRAREDETMTEGRGGGCYYAGDVGGGSA